MSVFIREGGAHPQAALGVHWPTLGHCLGVTWMLNVPVCSLSWLLVYTVFGTLLRSMGRGRTT